MEIDENVRNNPNNNKPTQLNEFKNDKTKKSEKQNYKEEDEQAIDIDMNFMKENLILFIFRKKNR